MAAPTASLALQFSHFGFYVQDLPRMASFYKEALRFTQTDAGDLGPVQLVFLSRDPTEHHQIVLATGRPEGLSFNLINQISFRVPDLDTLRAFHGLLTTHGAHDVQPVTHGNAISVYCRDPEGNRLELFLDTPWYCEQPLREPVDLSQTDAQIMSRAEAIARATPRFMSREVWQADVAERMLQDQRRPS
ncbi:MAG: glyoxalase/bleomycin resistance/dioxygenase protein [Polaromonas sp.]|nr:glyoxalase/bleomycin resistance/dioxygenase protein [Polaromonas sp.]